MRLTKESRDNNYVIDTYISLNEPFKTPINKLGQYEDVDESPEHLAKIKKVLEILLKKEVQIKALKVWNKTYKGKLNYQNYLDILEDCDLGEKLTQEEFDSLKEMML